jgi:hypothetical protein
MGLTLPAWQAKRRHAEALAEIEARSTNLRAEPKVLGSRLVSGGLWPNECWTAANSNCARDAELWRNAGCRSCDRAPRNLGFRAENYRRRTIALL